MKYIISAAQGRKCFSKRLFVALCATMLPVLDELEDIYHLNRVMVADKGLNTSTNIALNVAKGNGFIFPQFIRGTKQTKALRS